MYMYTLFLISSLILAVVNAQVSCDNYGVANGSSCACPPGFGGSTCSDPGCGGDIFQGTSRSLAQAKTDTSPSFANLTASSCSCEDGWGGFGCNVCQTASACQKAFSSSGGSSSSILDSGMDNSTLVCNTTSQVNAAGMMSCAVDNPTLAGLFPGAVNLDILRTLQPSLTPIPNVTGFGPAGSVYAQLWYLGVEQFYCQASSCNQTIESGTTAWTCDNLQCTCRMNTSFCGGTSTNLAETIDSLGGSLTISCSEPSSGSSSTSCSFQQSILNTLFGSSGLSLTDCTFGECVAQGVIDTSLANSSSSSGSHKSLSGGVIAGLAVVGSLMLLALLSLLFGLYSQKRARRIWDDVSGHGGVTVRWRDISYIVRGRNTTFGRRKGVGATTVLGGVSGQVQPGQMMAILGPSGAGKTSLVEILAQKQKTHAVLGTVSFTSAKSFGEVSNPHIAFVPQADILPTQLSVREALIFSASLRLPESVPPCDRLARVDEVIEQLGLTRVAHTHIGSHAHRGISGGEMRRVSIGLELVSRPDVLILDEPTSGLDSVSAAKVAEVLRDVSKNEAHPVAVIATIHQPSSRVYHTFDSIMLLSRGQAMYSGPGGLDPARYFSSRGYAAPGEGYNLAEHLLDLASERQLETDPIPSSAGSEKDSGTNAEPDPEKHEASSRSGLDAPQPSNGLGCSTYVTTFLTQFEVLSGREWKFLRRDKSLFVMHASVACVLGVCCGGLYFKTGDTIAGFQSRVGCLFFLGALIAFFSLSALYNVVETRPLFMRERSNAYYSPTAWLLARIVFDVVPLRIIPTIIVSTITYWMAGLAEHAANFFKFLFILVLYSLAMTLYNFLLATVFTNGSIATLLSALSALYQMTFAGFFVHLTSIPPVLRWLQWLNPLKYTLEALSVNEVGSGLMIQDTLQGVPVNVSATLIMQLLFGFGTNNYYRDVLVLFGFIAGFGIGVIGIVWFWMRERR